MTTPTPNSLDLILSMETAGTTTLTTLATQDLPGPSTAPATATELLDEEELVSKYYLEVPETDFNLCLTEEVGSGGFAAVCKVKVALGAVVLKASTAYAFKRFQSATLVASAAHRLRREVAVARSLASCPGIHPTVGGVVKKGCNGILMHCADESLRDVALHFAERERNGTLTAEQRRLYFVFVARAMLSVVAAL